MSLWCEVRFFVERVSTLNFKIWHFCRNTLLCHVAGLSLDAVGASSFMWKQQHVVGHHAFTNVDSEDPDIRVKPDGSDVRRVTTTQPIAAHHRWQHLYLGLLYGLLAVKSIFVDDFSALSAGRIGPVKISKLAPHEAICFWAGKIFFVGWYIVAPLAVGNRAVHELVGLWALSLAMCGWTLAFMFQVCSSFAFQIVKITERVCMSMGDHAYLLLLHCHKLRNNHSSVLGFTESFASVSYVNTLSLILCQLCQ